MRNTTMLGISMIALIAYIIINIILVIYIVVIYSMVGVKFDAIAWTSGGIAVFVLLIIGILALVGLDVYFALVIQSFRLEIIASGSGSGLSYPN